MNYQPGAPGSFDWQRGYGALSVGPQGLQFVIEYVLSQKEHHHCSDLIAAMERTVEESPGVHANTHHVQAR